VTDFRRQSVERPGWCEIAAQQPPQKKATSSKASQKISKNDVFAGESQTKKITKKKAGRWRKFRKREQRERRSVAG
jgi:hypothetical protein